MSARPGQGRAAATRRVHDQPHHGRCREHAPVRECAAGDAAALPRAAADHRADHAVDRPVGPRLCLWPGPAAGDVAGQRSRRGAARPLGGRRQDQAIAIPVDDRGPGEGTDGRGAGPVPGRRVARSAGRSLRGLPVRHALVRADARELGQLRRVAAAGRRGVGHQTRGVRAAAVTRRGAGRARG